MLYTNICFVNRHINIKSLDIQNLFPDRRLRLKNLFLDYLKTNSLPLLSIKS